MTAAPDPIPGAACPYPAMPPPVPARLLTGQDECCPYLPDRTQRMRFCMAQRIHGSLYHDFMDAGFRRSGTLLYQPVCPNCRRCQPIRVPVADFHPDKSQRRCWRRNQDLFVAVDHPRPTPEKHDLYRRYLTARHSREMEEDFFTFASFLYDSPVTTIECSYRDPAGRLLAIGICDVCPESLSTVYFFYEPAETRRGLGTFGALWEIDHARQLNIPWYYMGYWVEGSPSMEYKASFRPHQILHADGIWRSNERGRPAQPPST